MEMLPGVSGLTCRIAPRGKSHPGGLWVLVSKEPLSHHKVVSCGLLELGGAGLTSKQTKPVGAGHRVPSALERKGCLVRGVDNDFCPVSKLRGQRKPKASSRRG